MQQIIRKREMITQFYKYHYWFSSKVKKKISDKQFIFNKFTHTFNKEYKFSPF